MATGMQTGRRTGVSAMRTGAAPAPAAGGGPLKGIQKSWGEMDSKKKMLIIAAAVIIIVGIVAANVVSSANKPVQLYAGTISSSDSSEIQQKLLSWGIPCQIEGNGTNVLVHPKYKSRALMQLAQEGLPRKPVSRTNDILGAASGGMVPETKEDKERKLLMGLEGDMVYAIRQISGVADAYVKIVPKPENAWGEEKASAKASVMLRLNPGTKLSKQQVSGIVYLVTSSVAGLEPDQVKIVDTNGKILNDKLGGSEVAGGGEEYGGPEYLQQRQAIEKDLTQKVQSALDNFVGAGRTEVRVSVDMDFSQKEQETTHYGGVSDTGNINAPVSKEVESYSTEGGSSSESGDSAQQLSGTTSDKPNYNKEKVSYHPFVDKTKTRKVTTTPTIKRITCSVMVDGVKDPEMISRVEQFAKNSIGFDPSRGDEIAVVPFAKAVNSVPGSDPGMFGAAFPQPQAQPEDAKNQMPAWLPVMVAIPLVLIVLFAFLFYMKQKNVQREKQRLVLSTGPGATVSDISDLLADKEGKVTPPPATKVNTTDQLENLAKEKPTKVAELLKSTWLADR